MSNNHTKTWDIDLAPFLSAEINRINNKNKWHVSKYAVTNTPYEWIMVLPHHQPIPSSGWKIHISAILSDAINLLQTVLPILLNRKLAFKFPANLQLLANLNNESYSASQAGKFITIYPKNKHNIFSIAQQLHQATRCFRGPQILSDQPLFPCSLIHYRWGGFLPAYAQTYFGEIVTVAHLNKKKLIIDRRQPFYSYPKGISSPFKQWQIETLRESNELLNNRYLPVRLLNRSVRGDVCLAFDILKKRRCVLKIAFRHAYIDHQGRDACHRLKYEKNILTKLKLLEKSVPEVYDDFTDNYQNYIVVLEDIAGRTLDKVILERSCQLQYPLTSDVLTCAYAIINILDNIHQTGIVHADIKLSNIILTEDNQFRLIDFDIAHDISSQLPRLGCGSKGYSSPELIKGLSPCITDDIYSLGATLFYYCLNASASAIGEAGIDNPRKIRLINSQISPALEKIILKCLDPHSSGRYQNIAELRLALDNIPKKYLLSKAARRLKPYNAKKYLNNAKIIGDYLIERCYDPSQIGAGFSCLEAGSYYLHDLRGTAGCVLALSALWQRTNNKKYKKPLLDAVRALIEQPTQSLNKIPGLYVGESGVALAILKAGLSLQSAEILQQAQYYLNDVIKMPHGSPDLFNGSAGRLKVIMEFNQYRKAKIYADSAKQTVAFLLRHLNKTPEGLYFWPLPEISCLAHPSNKIIYDNKVIQLGYSHGMAGIADALLDYYLITKDIKSKNIIIDIANLLIAQAQSLPNNKVGWSAIHNEEVSPAFWCHGATGIGKFLLRLQQHQLIPDLWPLIRATASACVDSAKNALPIQCHGLSGNIEYLLDCYKLSNDKYYLNSALLLYDILETWILDLRNFPWSSADVKLKSYMSGLPGIINCCLEMANASC